MHTGFLLGRVITGLYYLYAGIGAMMKLPAMAGYAAAKGVPAPMMSVFVAHALLVIAGLCFITGWRPALGVVCTVLFFVPVTFSMHAFWAISDPAQQQQQLANFTRNLALMGSSLMFLGIPRPWPSSVESHHPVRPQIPVTP
jgi:uncharacterized membrane protein YphA (DoxX/SURF4 family)